MGEGVFMDIKRYLFIGIGFLCVLLAAIGLFLPLLPTTPFLLLASFLFLRSSKRLHHWLLNHKVFGRFIHDYLVHKSIPLRTKILAIICLWVSLGLSIFLVQKPVVSIILPLVGVGVTIHLLSLRSRVPSEFLDNMKRNEYLPINSDRSK